MSFHFGRSSCWPRSSFVLVLYPTLGSPSTSESSSKNTDTVSGEEGDVSSGLFWNGRIWCISIILEGAWDAGVVLRDVAGIQDMILLSKGSGATWK